MKQLKQLSLTLLLLITAATGAWAQGPWTSGSCTLTLNNGTLTVSGNGAMADYESPTDRPWDNNRNDITSVVMESGVTTVGQEAFYYSENLTSVTLPEGLTAISRYAFQICGKLTSVTIPSTVTSIGDDAFYGCGAVTDVNLYADPANLTWDEKGDDDFKENKGTQCHVLAKHLSAYQTKFNGKVNVTFVGDLEPLLGIMVLDNAKTTATMTMPANDVTVSYTLVRDMQDQANPVTFSGLPTTGNIVVKKGDDGKYQPAEALTIQLNDALISGDDKNIIAADGLTVTVEKKGEGDTWTSGTLADFQADMQPGTYRIKATATDETSPYEGTVTSTEFTVVEQYDLTVKPANDFSKGKIENVTVGSESVTIDANTGEATKTGIAPNTDVKIKAKRGYVIEKVETRKQGSGKTFVPGTKVQDLSSFVEVENNKDGTITLHMPTLNPSTYNVTNSTFSNGENTLHFGYHYADNYWSGFIGLNISEYTWNGHTAFSELDKTIDITSGEKYVYVIITSHQVSATCPAPGYEHFWGMYCYTNPVKVTYNLGGGSVSGSTADKVEYLFSGDALATTFAAPTREGYTFDGWYTSAEGGTKLTTSNATSATTIYAHWNAIAE